LAKPKLVQTTGSRKPRGFPAKSEKKRGKTWAQEGKLWKEYIIMELNPARGKLERIFFEVSRKFEGRHSNSRGKKWCGGSNKILPSMR